MTRRRAARKESSLESVQKALASCGENVALDPDPLWSHLRNIKARS